MKNSRQVTEVLKAIGEKLEQEKDFLTELDAAIGDSDHGINMARGFSEVLKKLPDLADRDVGTILKTTGMTLVSTVGGASGPLYGSAFMKAGAAAADKNSVGAGDLIIMLEAAAEAVKQRGKSTAEEKTMLDAMFPSLAAMKKEAADQEKSGVSDAKGVVGAGVKAAWLGVEHTKELIATKGRASYLGERSLGHQDPGATSFAYILEVIGQSLED